MRILRIRNVTLAVRDIERARETFATLFGAQPGAVEALAALGVRASDVALGEGTLRLAEPADEDSPLARFLARQGEAFYNVALEVDDLDAAVAELRERDVRVSEPAESEPGARSAFVAMAATHGLSIQLVEIADASPAPAAPPEPAAPLDLTPDEWSDSD